MGLRPYQLAALDTSKKKFEAGITRQLIALPTGTGKTPLFSMVRSHFGFQRRVMVLVHREELAAQAADKLQKWNPNAIVGVEMASSTAPPMATFVVASVATIGRAGSERLYKFNPEEFDAIVCDEAHHSTAQSYLNVFNHFGLLNKDNKKLLMGVTATPNRGDGTPLASVYDEIVYQMSILDAIKQGWLVNLRGMRVHTKTSLDGVHTRAGDFAQDELQNAVNTPERNDVIVRKWMEHAGDRSSVVFTVDIKHAQDLAARFKHYGIACEAVWGDDPGRAEKLRYHRSGGLRVLCNCGVLTEGYDDPNIGCIVLARPTKSGLLFVQMAGRGTRLPEGVNNLLEATQFGLKLSKEDCIVMDVVDNTSKHSLVTLNTIFGLGQKLDPKKMKITELVDKVAAAKAKNPSLDLDKAETIAQLEAMSQEVNLFEVRFPEEVLNNSLLQWHQNSDKDSFVLLLPEKESIAIVPNILGGHSVVGKVKNTQINQGVKTLPEAFDVADHFVSDTAPEYLRILKREATWMKDVATPNQTRLLGRLRIPFPPDITKGDAAKLITQHLARKSFYNKVSRKAA